MLVRTLLSIPVLTAAAILSGCGPDGPELVDVHGTVTMDGEPLEGAHIKFQRSDYTGRPSYGSTDEDGYYRLGYSSSREGVMLGDFIVSISTYTDPYTDEDGTRVPRRPETVPMKYNVNSELTATIKEEGQEVSFDLKSDGEIAQGGGF